MKKLFLALLCACLLCFGAVKQAEANPLLTLLNSGIPADFKVMLIYAYAPRFLTVHVVDADGEPVVGEEVTFMYSYREYFNIEEKQPFNPIEQLPIKLTTNAKGQVTFIITWCHGFVYCQDDVQEDGFGVPFKFYDMTFVVNQ
jgi:hypothetical protein